MRRKSLLVLGVIALTLVLAGWKAGNLYQAVSAAATAGTGNSSFAEGTVPVVSVKRGDVPFSITARGELQGGNTEMLSAPMAGGGALAITFLRESGELVKKGDVVVQFDTTEQNFKLREAQADLAESEQQLIQANAESEAKEEEARYELLKAKSELKIAQLESRKNDVVARIVARQNELAVSSATDKVAQLEKDYKDRVEAARAGIIMQEAARTKAKVAAETAQRNINLMTLRSNTGGYVARQQNMQGNFNWGSYLPALQVGDNVRAGMAVAQIPDLSNWETIARIGELDRGHLTVGQSSEIRVVALPDKKFSGTIRTIGGTTGPPWDPRFECKVSVDNPSKELRPGMSVRLIVTTQVLNNVLWLPLQALFESDGRSYVYIRKGSSFTTRDVTLVRRSESRVVIEGLKEGEVVALANPDDVRSKKGGGSSALEAISR